MQHSSERILTTHTGSLPRPPSLQDLLYAQERGEAVDQAIFEREAREAVNAVVRQQASCGLDIVNDGEMSKFNYSNYIKDRLSGFQGASKPPTLQGLSDLLEFPEYAQRVAAAMPVAGIRTPSCTGPITYTGADQLRRDLANLEAASREVQPAEVFMTAASPGTSAGMLSNQYYPSYEAYLYALADAMKTEYEAIYRAGFLLQLDCPDLILAASNKLPSFDDREAPSQDARDKLLTLHVEALNSATRDIPPGRMRMHVCWGNYEGPHHRDVPLRDLMGALLRARPAALVLEAANPRHAHEWQVLEDVKLPEDKLLVLGVLDTTTNFIEHPELVAQRLVRVARLVGRERVMAGTDCGFATIAGFHMVDPKIVWAKMQAMVEGAHLASQRLW